MIAGLSVLGLITARGGSKGVPGKNILPVGGQPLIAWTIQAARGSRFVDRLVLSSDDHNIIEVARAYGCEAPYVRPADLAADSTASIDVVLDALGRLPDYDIVVLLQPTSPLRTSADIDNTLERLHVSGAPTCVTLRPANEHPYWTFKVGPDGHLERFAEPLGGVPARRQDLPAAWCLNGAVYAARVEWLMRHKTFVCNQTVCHPMPAERSLDVDTAEDVERLKAAFAHSPAILAPSFPD